MAETIVNPDLPKASKSDEDLIRAAMIEEGFLNEDGSEPEAAAPAAEAEVAAAPEAEAEPEGNEAQETPPAAEAAKPEAKPEEDGAAISRGLAALAQKESKLHERELKLREIELRAAQAEARVEQLRRMAIEDPAGFYRAIGVEKTAEIGQDLYYAEFGDNVPPAIKEARATRGIGRRVQEMEQRFQEQQKAYQAQQAEMNAVAFFSRVVTQVPDDLPYLRDEASADPAGVAKAMYATMTALAQNGGIVEGDTDEIIAAKVGKTINDRLATAVERLKKIHKRSLVGVAPATKIENPVAEESPPAVTRTLTKKTARASIRPKKTELTREEELDLVEQKLKAGDYTPL